MSFVKNALLEFSTSSIETFHCKKVKESVKYQIRFAIYRFFSQTYLVQSKKFNLVETEVITAYIGLGSNFGDRAGNLLLAVRGLLEASFTVFKLSAIYETEPVGVENHAPFLNMVAEIRLTGISPSQMMARMLRIEYLLGRRDKNLKKPRSVDLDLLLFGDVAIRNRVFDFAASAIAQTPFRSHAAG